MNHLLAFIGEVILDLIGTTSKIMTDSFTTQIDEMATFYGGRGGNAAYAASNVIAGPVLIGAVGNDFKQSGYWDHLNQTRS